jgi:hypothetical protein
MPPKVGSIPYSELIYYSYPIILVQITPYKENQDIEDLLFGK